MGMAAIMFNGAEAFEQILNNLSTAGPLWNLVKIYCSSSFKEEIWKLHNFIHVYRSGTQADNPQGGQNFACN